MLGLCSAQNGQVLDHQYTSSGLPSAWAGSNRLPSSSVRRGMMSALPRAGKGGALVSSAAAETGCASAAKG